MTERLRLTIGLYRVSAISADGADLADYWCSEHQSTVDKWDTLDEMREQDLFAEMITIRIPTESSRQTMAQRIDSRYPGFNAEIVRSI